MEIKVKKLREGAKLPFRATSQSAGADIYALPDGEEATIQPGGMLTLPTGISIEIPEGFAGLIFPRSSLGAKYGVTLSNSVGVIDSDYRGEIKIPLINLGNSGYTVKKGDRIAQLLIMPVEICSYALSENLNRSERGEGGFGSTGKN